MTFNLKIMSYLNRLDAIRILAGKKSPTLWDSYDRNSMECTVNHQLNYPISIITMVKLFAPPMAWDLWIRPIQRR
jgi:hypothetical protein